MTFDHSYLIFLTIFFLFGYFMGSIPFGLLLSKISGLGDIRKIGSGNIGATNVLRTGNKKNSICDSNPRRYQGCASYLCCKYFSKFCRI